MVADGVSSPFYLPNLTGLRCVAWLRHRPVAPLTSILVEMRKNGTDATLIFNLLQYFDVVTRLEPALACTKTTRTLTSHPLIHPCTPPDLSSLR